MPADGAAIAREWPGLAAHSDQPRRFPNMRQAIGSALKAFETAMVLHFERGSASTGVKRRVARAKWAPKSLASRRRHPDS